MPIHMNVCAISRSILIVARGQVSVDEIIECIRKLKPPEIRGYAKIVDVTCSTSDVTREQVNLIAAPLRAGTDTHLRGPLAFVVDRERQGFAEVFADVTSCDRPIALFGSLHDARRWLADNLVERPGRPPQRPHSGQAAAE